MTFDMASVGAKLQGLQAELQLINNTIKDKGHQRFQRAFILAAILVFAAYYLLYMPSRTKLSRIQRSIDVARLTAQSADTYKQLRDQIKSTQAMLPKTSDKDKFLTQAVIETLKSEGITSDSIQPPVEKVQGDVVYQSLSVSAEVRFAEVVA